jgi:WD40 repeat protein
MNPFYHPTPPVIPDHELLRIIGQGAYGEIWLARTVIGIYRAVKIVYRSNFESDRPYEREFRGIQQFEPISRTHAGLVDVLQIGRNDEGGYFYYVMELADDGEAGRPFDPETYCPKSLGRELARRSRLPAAECLEVGRGLAAALAHLHNHGLVHRDIKPDNIIFVNGEPKLADIGLVAAVEGTKSSVGTAGYIPPEGAGTARADIFALAMVLYQMSTGESREAFANLPLHSHEWPDFEVVAELNEVVVKAGHNNVTQRHQRAEDLRAELELLLAGKSVKRLRFVEQQLALLRSVALVAVVIALAGVGYSWVTNHMRAREEKLLARAYVTGGTSLIEDGNLHGALPAFAEALRLQLGDETEVETARVRVGSLLQQSPRLLQFWDEKRPVSDVRFSPDGTQLLVAGRRSVRLVDINTQRTIRDFPLERSAETAVFSPEGQSIAIANGSFVTVEHIDTQTNLLTYHAPAAVTAAEFSPDGKRLVVACADQCAYVINARDGSLDFELTNHTKGLWYAAFSPDGLSIVTAGEDGTARLWDAASGELRNTFTHAQWVFCAAVSPDGQNVVTASSDRTLRVWNTNGSLALPARMEHRASIRRVSYSPDGRYIISAGWDQSARVWDARTGRPVGSTLNLHTAAMQAVFDPDARRVATVGAAGEIKVWQLRPEAPKNLGPLAMVSGDGARYITIASNTFQFWNAHTDTPLTQPLTASGLILTGLCHHSGSRVAVATADDETGMKKVEVFDASGALSSSFLVENLAGWWMDPLSTRLLISERRGRQRVLFCLDAATGKLIFEKTDLPMSIHSAAFAPNGRMLAIGGQNNSLVYLLDPGTGDTLVVPWKLQQNVRSLAFSSDSARLLTASGGSAAMPASAQLWDTGAGISVGQPMPHARTIFGARFSHDGQRIVSWGEDQRAAIWKAASQEPSIDPISLLSYVRSAEFSPDDRWLVTATWHEVQVWSADSGLAVTPPLTDPAIFDRAGFCAAGRRIWTSSRRGVLLWDMPREAGAPDELVAFADHLGVTIPAALRRSASAFSAAQLRARCDKERARTDAQINAWRLAQIELCEARKDGFAAQFHLEKLLAALPNDASLRERLESTHKQRKDARP